MRHQQRAPQSAAPLRRSGGSASGFSVGLRSDSRILWRTASTPRKLSPWPASALEQPTLDDPIIDVYLSYLRGAPNTCVALGTIGCLSAALTAPQMELCGWVRFWPCFGGLSILVARSRNGS